MKYYFLCEYISQTKVIQHFNVYLFNMGWLSLFLGRKAMTYLDSVLKKQGYHFTNKGPNSQSNGFSSIYVQMWEMDHKEGWVLKNWCFQTVVLKKTLDSPLDIKDIKPVNHKGNQPWVVIGKTDAEASTLATWWEQLIHWKRPRCWERLRAGGEGGNRGWEDWMASLTQWTWVWANSRRWRRTGKCGTLQSVRLQRVRGLNNNSNL